MTFFRYFILLYISKCSFYDQYILYECYIAVNFGQLIIVSFNDLHMPYKPLNNGNKTDKLKI